MGGCPPIKLGLLIWILTMHATTTHGKVCTSSKTVPEEITMKCKDFLNHLTTFTLTGSITPPGKEELFGFALFNSDRMCIAQRMRDVTYQGCCDGWSGDLSLGCPKPVCNEECELNGGKCVEPRNCDCTGTGKGGPNCNIEGAEGETGVITQQYNIPFRTCISAGTHYWRTMDGKEYVFGGSCAYVVAQSEDFKMIVEHVGCENYGMCKKRVIIEVVEGATSTHIILFDKTVTVNGFDFAYSSNPTSCSSRATITYVDVIHLTVMPMITIKFDFKTTLQISMPKQHSYNIQGLCGNNNGDASDLNRNMKKDKLFLILDENRRKPKDHLTKSA